MKLSEAIRLGAMLKPQGYEVLYGARTCALGAASDALGFEESAKRYDDLVRLFPFLSERATCPVPFCDYGHGEHDPPSNLRVVWHLNDLHRWDRCRIADWVATVEPRDDDAPVTAPTTTHQEQHA